MKLLRHVFIGFVVSSLLVSSAFAVYFEPVQPFYFVEKNTFGFFIGVDDGVLWNGAKSATTIGYNFRDYGGTVWGFGKSGKNGNENLTTGNIAASLWNFGDTSTFKNMKNFVFYLNGHGYRPGPGEENNIFIGSDGVHNNYGITDKELTQYLNYLPSDVNKVVILDSCYSGGFLDELKTLKNITVITAANEWSWTVINPISNDTFFSARLAEFFAEKSGEGWDTKDLGEYLESDPYHKLYFGMKLRGLDSDEERIFTPEDWNVQFYQSPTYEPVPEPSTILLFGGGLAGIIFIQWRLRKRLGL